jgi:hypothetical protein
LIEHHVEALFVHDEHGRLLTVNEPGGGTAPRFYLGMTEEGIIWRYRSDLDSSIAAELNALCKLERQAGWMHEPQYLKEYEKLLPDGLISMGPAFVFPDYPGAPKRKVLEVTNENKKVLRGGLDAWIVDLERGTKLFVIMVDGQAVSVCASVRETLHCHEAGVETLNEYRGRGYAADVASAWANKLISSKLMPLYSTSWENIASRNVAKKLGLNMYGVDFHIQ